MLEIIMNKKEEDIKKLFETLLLERYKGDAGKVIANGYDDWMKYVLKNLDKEIKPVESGGILYGLRYPDGYEVSDKYSILAGGYRFPNEYIKKSSGIYTAAGSVVITKTIRPSSILVIDKGRYPYYYKLIDDFGNIFVSNLEGLTNSKYTPEVKKYVAACAMLNMLNPKQIEVLNYE